RKYVSAGWAPWTAREYTCPPSDRSNNDGNNANFIVLSPPTSTRHPGASRAAARDDPLRSAAHSVARSRSCRRTASSTVLTTARAARRPLGARARTVDCPWPLMVPSRRLIARRVVLVAHARAPGGGPGPKHGHGLGGRWRRADVVHARRGRLRDR